MPGLFDIYSAGPQPEEKKKKPASLFALYEPEALPAVELSAAPEFLPDIEPPSRLQRLAMGPVGQGVEFLGSALSRLAPFPGLIEAIQTGDKKNIMSQIARVFPRAVEETFQGTVENVKKYISPEAGKLIEDVMANYPAFQGMKFTPPPGTMRGMFRRGEPIVDPRAELKRIFQKRAAGEALTPEEQATFTYETGIAPEPPKLLEGPVEDFPPRDYIPPEKPLVTEKVPREILQPEEVPTYTATETRQPGPPTLDIPTRAEVQARDLRTKFLGENAPKLTEVDRLALNEMAGPTSEFPVEIKKAAADILETLTPKTQPKPLRQTPRDVQDTIDAVNKSQDIAEVLVIGKATKHAGIRKAARERVKVLKSAPEAPILFQKEGLPVEEPPPSEPARPVAAEPARPPVTEQRVQEEVDRWMAGKYAGHQRDQVEFMVRRMLKAPPKAPEFEYMPERIGEVPARASETPHPDLKPSEPPVFETEPPEAQALAARAAEVELPRAEKPLTSYATKSVLEAMPDLPFGEIARIETNASRAGYVLQEAGYPVKEMLEIIRGEKPWPTEAEFRKRWDNHQWGVGAEIAQNNEKYFRRVGLKTGDLSQRFSSGVEYADAMREIDAKQRTSGLRLAREIAASAPKPVTQEFLPETPARQVPTTPLRPKALQKAEPTPLEQGGLTPPELGLFEKPKPVPEGELSPEEIAARDEMRGLLGGKVKEPEAKYGATEPPKYEPRPGDERAATRFRESLKDYPERVEASPTGGYDMASDTELVALSRTSRDPGEMVLIGMEARNRIEHRGFSEAETDEIWERTEPYMGPIDMGRTILEALMGTLQNQKGMAVLPFRLGDIERNFDAFIDHLATLSKAGKDFGAVELKNFSKKFWKQFRIGQFYAARVPEYRPIYDELHKFDWKAYNESVSDINRFPALASYFRLPKARARILNNALIETRETRTRLTPAGLQNRGLTPDEQTMYERVLDYGNYRLDKWIDFHAERIARAEAARRQAQTPDPSLDLGETGGMSPELMAWAREQAATRISDLRDVYVPFSRFGKKTITVKDFTGEIVNFSLAESGFERAKTVRELERTLYPPRQGYRIEIGELREAVGKGLLQDIDMGTLEILSRFADVAPETAQAFLAEVAPYLAKRGAQARFIKASEMPGFERDLKRGIVQMTESQNRYMERIRTRDSVTELIKALPEDAYELRDFAKEEADFVLGGAKETAPLINQFRNATYIFWLGGQVKQFPVQMSILATNVYPRLGKYSNTPIRDMYRGITDAYGRFEKLNIQEQDAIDQGFRRGVLRPRLEPFFGDLEPFTPRTPFTEVGGTMEHAKMAATPMRRYGDYLRRALMFPTFMGDFKSRQVAALVFYRAGRRNGMSHEAAIDFMERETNFTNHTFDAANRPRVFRGNVGELFGVMRHYLLNQLNMWRTMVGEGEYKMLTKSVAIALGLSGVVGVPGWEILRSIMNLLGNDPEEETRAWLKNWKAPDWLSDVSLHGIPGLLGIDLSRSLGMGDIIPADIFQGRPSGIAVPLSLLERSAKAMSVSLKKIDALSGRSPIGPTWMDLADAWTPLQSLKNVRSGQKLSEYGVTTPSGDKIGDVGPVAPWLRGLGFNPMEEAKLRGAHRALQIERDKLQDDKTGATHQMAQAILKGDIETQQNLINRIYQYNLRVGPTERIRLDPDEIRDKLKRMKIPEAQIKRLPRQLRPRAPELAEEYGAPLYGFPP